MAPQPGRTVEQVDREVREMSDSLVKLYAADVDPQIATRPWEALPDTQRRAVRARNEIARRKRAAEQATEQAAERQRVEQRDQAAANQAIDAYKREMRAGFPGDDAAFVRAWPRILEQWQIEQAQQRRGAVYAEKRAMLKGMI